ncbi:MAG: tetratricopeptide repeat protein [Chitinivibrionales bacterium]|nr:tetratricopeptide repeat protein [Chitinivibrionales bacterium]
MTPGKKKHTILITGAILMCIAILFVFIRIRCRLLLDNPDKLAVLQTDKPAAGDVTIQYPFDNAVFPPEIPAPVITWRDSAPDVDRWLVRIQCENPDYSCSRVSLSGSYRPREPEWERIKSGTMGSSARITVTGIAVSLLGGLRFVSTGSITIHTSPDSVGSPVFYREVNLPFVDAVKDPSHIQWRFGPVGSRTRPPAVLKNLPVCGNCHSFSSDGAILGMDIDYANDKGSYATMEVTAHMEINPGTIISWADFRRETDSINPTFGLLSRVSPCGNYVVSTVKDRSVFVPRAERAFSQLFFPVKGILCTYSRETGKFKSLPGADNPEYVQSNPEWSPDGNHIVFARSKAYRLEGAGDKVLLSREDCREFLEGGKKFRFDLYRVPFNNGNGGKARPLRGAADNGMSNYFARYSPDGAWIVFCKSDSYMLLQPDSRLYIMPADGGSPREMACNLSRMNSWHSWSPNGKWLVFSSKELSDYTQLFLTHIDKHGRSSRPVLLERFTAENRAANIPEFVNASPHRIKNISENFVNDYSLIRSGDALLRDGDTGMAIDAYNQARRANPENEQVLFKLGDIHQQQGNHDKAASLYYKALEINPALEKAHTNLGVILETRGTIDQAIRHYKKAIQLKPGMPKAYNNLGVALQKQGKFSEAIEYLHKAVSIENTYAIAHFNLAAAYFKSGNRKKAQEHYTIASRLDNRIARHGNAHGN